VADVNSLPHEPRVRGYQEPLSWKLWSWINPSVAGGPAVYPWSHLSSRSWRRSRTQGACVSGDACRARSCAACATRSLLVPRALPRDLSWAGSLRRPARASRVGAGGALRVGLQPARGRLRGDGPRRDTRARAARATSGSWRWIETARSWGQRRLAGPGRRAPRHASRRRERATCHRLPCARTPRSRTTTPRNIDVSPASRRRAARLARPRLRGGGGGLDAAARRALGAPPARGAEPKPQRRGRSVRPGEQPLRGLDFRAESTPSSWVGRWRTLRGGEPHRAATAGA
jgi:hypothetical protein